MAKILIVFDSDTGKNEVLAEKSKAVLEALGAEVRIRRVIPVIKSIDNKVKPHDSTVSVIEQSDLDWGDGYIFNCPIHTGAISASMKYFFDDFHGAAARGLFLNKPVTAMTTGKISHAGAETTIQQLYGLLMHWGSLIVPTSIVYPEINHVNGNPYGLSFLLDEANSFGDDETLTDILKTHFTRFVKVVEVNIPIVPQGGVHDKSHLPYTISGALG